MKLKIPKGCKKSKDDIDLKDKKVRTKLCRFSYLHLHGEPKEYEGKRSWGLQMLFKKESDIKDLEIAAYNAAIEKWGPNIDKWPKNKKTGKCKVLMPFKSGDEDYPDNKDYEGMIVVGAKRNEFNHKEEKQKPPQVCGPNPADGLIGADEIKSGDYGSCVVIAIAYEVGKNAGVSFTLTMVQKQKNGKALGNGGNIEAEFEVVEMDDEEEDDEEEETSKKSKKSKSKKRDDDEDEDEDEEESDDEDDDDDDDEDDEDDDEDDEDDDDDDDDDEDDDDDDDDDEKPSKKSKKSKSKKKSKR